MAGPFCFMLRDLREYETMHKGQLGNEGCKKKDKWRIFVYLSKASPIIREGDNKNT